MRYVQRRTKIVTKMSRQWTNVMYRPTDSRSTIGTMTAIATFEMIYSIMAK